MKLFCSIIKEKFNGNIPVYLNNEIIGNAKCNNSNIEIEIFNDFKIKELMSSESIYVSFRSK